MFADRLRRGIDRPRLGDAFEDQGQVADRHPLVKQQTQHREQQIDRHPVGHQFVEQPLVGLGADRVGEVGELVEQAAQRAQAQEPAEIALHHLEEMRRQHFRGRDRGAAQERNILLGIGRDPARRRPVDRFLDVVARRQRHLAAGENGKHAVGLQPVARLFHALDPHHIGAGRQARVISQPDLGQDQPVDRGDVVAHVCDPCVEPGGRVEHHGDEVGGELDMDVVEIQHVAHAAFALLFGLGRGLRLRLGRGPRLVLAVAPPGSAPESQRAEHEGHEGQPGDQGEQAEQHGDGSEGRGIAAKLRKQREVGRPGRAAPGEQKRRRDRDDDGGDLAHQPVANRQDRIGLKGAADVHPVDGDAHDQPHQDVEERDEKPGDGVALDEFRGPVERAEEGGFLLLALAPRLGLLMGDRARGHVGVDGELFTRHAVEGKPRTHLGHPPRTLGDHDEIDDQQHQEDDEAEEHAPRHHEARKPFDHVAGGGGAGVAVADDQLGRGDVEREPQHEAREQHGRKGRKLQRPLDEQRHREHQDRQREGDGQPGVEHPGRHRQDHHHDDRHEREREQDRRTEDLCEGRCHLAP